MSRSGYGDDCDYLELYRGAVDSALQGKRGQAFLRELVAALDAMDEKVLISEELVNEQGKCCAIGAVCQSRDLNFKDVDYSDPDEVAKLVGVARSMAAEIAFMNDEWDSPKEEPAERWKRMRKWATDNIARAQRAKAIRANPCPSVAKESP